MIESIVHAIRSRQLIVFVGAGVSKNLGLPLGRELIAQIAKELDYDADVLRQYGKLAELAEYYKLMRSTVGPLRSWMDVAWHGDESRIDASRIHQSLVRMAPYAIYTTNYDRWIEMAFQRANQPYLKIANVGDFSKIQDVATQIIKFHGDFDDDQSLVLTEADYFERLSFESPLDLKLRADAIGRTLLFIGYSLEDINIRLMLYRLHKLWDRTDFAHARPKSFVFLSRPNPVQERVLQERGVWPIVSDEEHAGVGLSSFLERLVDEAFGAGTGR